MPGISSYEEARKWAEDWNHKPRKGILIAAIDNVELALKIAKINQDKEAMTRYEHALIYLRGLLKKQKFQ